MEAVIATGRYKINGLISEKGEGVKLEYILLFVNSKDQYAEFGLNDGFAYTSLPKEVVEDVCNGIMGLASLKKYALYQNGLMHPEANLLLTDLALVY